MLQLHSLETADRTANRLQLIDRFYVRTALNNHSESSCKLDGSCNSGFASQGPYWDMRGSGRN
jgi:hypothetical protein